MLKITFVSNYINHHQIPFCDAMRELCDFTFIQTEPMEAERVQMGWHEELVPDYVKKSYESDADRKACMQLIQDSDVVLFGGCEDESYIHPRLDAGRLTIRYSERVYRSGQWKCITPRGLRRKYLDHTKYRKGPVYLLCNGAYVASDFRIFRSYPGKMFRWGYFPELKQYDLDRLMADKGYVIREEDGSETIVPYLLWVARLIPLKHPELALSTAQYLRDQGLAFHMDIIGGGELEEQLKASCRKLGLEKEVRFLGAQKPEAVRSFMEKADILLFTSDRREGWGAVINEGMNSGCCVIADHMIGGAPSLIVNGKNGCIYPDHQRSFLMRMAAALVLGGQEREEMGRCAYRTIAERWNAREAALRLMKLIAQMQSIWGIEEGAHGQPTVSEREAAKAEQEIWKDWMQEEANGEDMLPPGPCTREIARSEAGIRKDIFSPR